LGGQLLIVYHGVAGTLSQRTGGKGSPPKAGAIEGKEERARLGLARVGANLALGGEVLSIKGRRRHHGRKGGARR
jgi:hypothetical protein